MIVTIDGVTYTTSGTYSNTYTNAAGCDSVHTLNLTINYLNSSTTNVIACDNYSWNGVTYTTSGTYTFTGNSYNNINGFVYGGTYNNSHYYISNNVESWHDANLISVSLGGNLVTFSDSGEQVILIH